MGMLDDKFIKSLTIQKVTDTFEKLKNSKTDMIPIEGEENIKLHAGSDYITHDEFSANIDRHAMIICEKGKSGNYCFEPFKEHRIPKPPYINVEEAIKAGKRINNEKKYIRVLSMSTIQDTIFQKLMASVLDKFADDKFRANIDLHSFAYRKDKSSKMAVKKIRRFVDNGYYYVLDGDIQGFFDEIDHTLLSERMKSFFGDGNDLLCKFLYRFIHVKKILPDTMWQYRSKKSKKIIDYAIAKKRCKGIPQGGVLSGLLANVFLYNFDLYVVNTLMPRYGFKYFRYADDFVLMFKSEDHIDEVYRLVRDYLLDKDKLVLHEIGDKTKKLDLSPAKNGVLDFLGFEITPGRLRIKEDNVQKFKNRIIQTLDEITNEEVIEATHGGKLSWRYIYFRKIVKAINLRITGLEDLIEQNKDLNGLDNGICPTCQKLIPKRSWIGYFMMVTDVAQLRKIDESIRMAIRRDYKKRTSKHLRKEVLLNYTTQRAEVLKSVVKIYIKYRKQVEKYGSKVCECERYFDKETGRIRVVEKNTQ